VRVRAALFVCFLAGICHADDALDRARALDQQGVRAFQQGRYRDAIRFFREALRGGPASELWNIAKCHLKLDEPQEADAVLGKYLERSDITAEDRREAEQLRHEIRSRPSPVTILSTPLGARVDIDGRMVGTTPITVEVQPGEHIVMIKHPAHGAREEIVEARWGRGVIVQAELGEGDGGARSRTVARARRLAIEIGAGPSFPRYADLGGTGLPHGYVGVTYALAATRRLSIGAGLRFGLWGDAWSNSANQTNAPPGCTAPLPNDFSAAELAGHVLGVLALDLAERWRAGLELGLGIAGTTAGSRVGGDVYDASCAASQSAEPSFHGGLDVSMRVAAPLRLVVRPITIDLHPSYDGARAASRGVWMRVGLAAGVAFDL
jgi:hypothetical protein